MVTNGWNTANPEQAYDRPRGAEKVGAPMFLRQHMKVVRVSAPCTGRLCPPGNIHGTHFSQGLSWPHGHNVVPNFTFTKNWSWDLQIKNHCYVGFPCICCVCCQPNRTLNAMKGNQVLGYNLCSKQWNKLFGRINVKKGCLLFKHNHNTRGSQKVRFPILLPPNNFT